MSNFFAGSSLPVLVAALVPLLFVVGALSVTARRPFLGVHIAATLAAIAAGLALVGHVHDGDTSTGWARLVGPTAPMLALVATLGLVVVRFSRTYLAGEAGLDRYARALAGLLASVSTLVLTTHLGVLVAAWLATSLCLHQLLTFYPDRPRAQWVAQKKFLVSRAADVLFVGALVLLAGEHGSLAIDVVNAHATAAGALSPASHAATVMLVLGILLRSAQLPFHGWMTEVMEAPTPVSALLHAGVVNIGGFVLLELAPLFEHAWLARALLFVVGGTTAVVGALVMTTRTSAKVTLAWSTIAQMGFMLAQCGLGAWTLAAFHLFAHSLYKAHAFLRAGSTVDVWRRASLVPRPRPTATHVALATAAMLAAGAAVLGALVSVGVAPSSSALVLWLALALVPLVAHGLAGGRRAALAATLAALGAVAAYLGGHALTAGVATTVEPPSFVPLAGLALLSLPLFAAQTLLVVRPRGRFATWLVPHLSAGFYLDDAVFRLVFRHWPPPISPPATAPRFGVVTTQEVR